MTNMLVYLIGTLFVVAGLAYAANRMGVSQIWIIAGALVIIGLGLMGGIVKTRQKVSHRPARPLPSTTWPRAPLRRLLACRAPFTRCRRSVAPQIPRKCASFVKRCVRQLALEAAPGSLVQLRLVVDPPTDTGTGLPGSPPARHESHPEPPDAVLPADPGSRAPIDRRAADAFHFENDILPILARYGCNSSGCHGKAEGQGGFKLSVFASDPEADYAALTKEGRGRRTFPAEAGGEPAPAQGHRPRRARRRHEAPVRR